MNWREHQTTSIIAQARRVLYYFTGLTLPTACISANWIHSNFRRSQRTSDRNLGSHSDSKALFPGRRTTGPSIKPCLRSPMSQSFTYIDVAGNRAEYSVSDEDQQSEFRWSTDHGDHGVSRSFAEAQCRARTMLKDSMAANRRSDQATRRADYLLPWRSR